MRFIRFLLAGGVNTFVAYVVYLCLLNWLDYSVSYFVAYGVGVLVAWLLARYFVFMSRGVSFSLGWHLLLHAVQFSSTSFLINYFVENLGLHESIALFPALIIVVPFGYLMSRAIFLR